MRDAPGTGPIGWLSWENAPGCLPSRFLHLFKAETGVPLRRHRIWNRIGGGIARDRGRPLVDRGRARRRLRKLGLFSAPRSATCFNLVDAVGIVCGVAE